MKESQQSTSITNCKNASLQGIEAIGPNLHAQVATPTKQAKACLRKQNFSNSPSTLSKNCEGSDQSLFSGSTMLCSQNLQSMNVAEKHQIEHPSKTASEIQLNVQNCSNLEMPQSKYGSGNEPFYGQQQSKEQLALQQKSLTLQSNSVATLDNNNFVNSTGSSCKQLKEKAIKSSKQVNSELSRLTAQQFYGSGNTTNKKTPKAHAVKAQEHETEHTLNSSLIQVGDTLQRFDNKYAATSSDKKNGRWTKDEHFRFLQALKMYGKEWRKVQQHVETRTSTQARSHAQKFFVKIEKKKLSLSEFLDGLDLDNLEKDMIMSDLEDDDCDSPKNKRQLKKHEKHFAAAKQAPAKTPKATTKSLLQQSPPSLTSMSVEQDDLESQGHNLDIEEHQQDQAKAHQKAMEKGGVSKPLRRGRTKKSDMKVLSDTLRKPESVVGASEDNVDDKEEQSGVVGIKRTHQFKDCHSNMQELQLVSEEIQAQGVNSLKIQARQSLERQSKTNHSVLQNYKKEGEGQENIINTFNEKKQSQQTRDTFIITPKKNREKQAERKSEILKRKKLDPLISEEYAQQIQPASQLTIETNQQEQNDQRTLDKHQINQNREKMSQANQINIKQAKFERPYNQNSTNINSIAPINHRFTEDFRGQHHSNFFELETKNIQPVPLTPQIRSVQPKDLQFPYIDLNVSKRRNNSDFDLDILNFPERYHQNDHDICNFKDKFQHQEMSVIQEHQNEFAHFQDSETHQGTFVNQFIRNKPLRDNVPAFMSLAANDQFALGQPPLFPRFTGQINRKSIDMFEQDDFHLDVPALPVQQQFRQPLPPAFMESLKTQTIAGMNADIANMQSHFMSDAQSSVPTFTPQL